MITTVTKLLYKRPTGVTTFTDWMTDNQLKDWLKLNPQLEILQLTREETMLLSDAEKHYPELFKINS